MVEQLPEKNTKLLPKPADLLQIKHRIKSAIIDIHRNLKLEKADLKARRIWILTQTDPYSYHLLQSSRSEEEPMESSVPQGSPLAPNHFE